MWRSTIRGPAPWTKSHARVHDGDQRHGHDGRALRLVFVVVGEHEPIVGETPSA